MRPRKTNPTGQSHVSTSTATALSMVLYVRGLLTTTFLYVTALLHISLALVENCSRGRYDAGSADRRRLRAPMPLPAGAATGCSEAAEGVGVERAPVPALPAPPATNPLPPPRPQHRAFFTADGGGGPRDRGERASSEEAGDNTAIARWRRRQRAR